MLAVRAKAALVIDGKCDRSPAVRVDFERRGYGGRVRHGGLTVRPDIEKVGGECRLSADCDWVS